MLLLTPAFAALTTDQAAQVYTWLYTDGLSCGTTRTNVVATYGATCPSLAGNTPRTICYNRLVNDCTVPDGDGDGYTADDCDDSDPGVHPGATETCDGVDEDCDGTVDEGACPTRTVGTSSLADADVLVRGASASARLGSALAMGDVNADGDADLLVAARGANVAYLFHGPISSLTLADADATYTGNASSNFGWSVAFPGDTTGDGVGEVVIGAPYNSSSRGAAYVWSGSSTGALTANAAPARLSGDTNGDQFGVKVCGAGDQDGDGVVDLLVGSWQDDHAASNAGSTYLYFGALSGNVTTAAADAELYGVAASDWSGYQACGGGDLDRDGWDDVLVGADGVDTGGTQSGAAYVFYGPVSGTRSLSTADATRNGVATYEYVGQSVAFLGDVTGDGWEDVGVGAFGRDHTARDSGVVYVYDDVLSGTATAATDALALAPSTASGLFGYRVLSAGDHDGDGYGDLAASAFQDDEAASNAGAVYLLYGPASSLDLATNAAKHLGEAASNETGYGVAAGADLDGDGLDDLAVGAMANDTAATDAGVFYVQLTGTP